MKLKKWHIALIVSAYAVTVLATVAFVVFVGFWFLFPTPKWKRRRMAEYYRSGRGCTVIEAFITEDDLVFEENELHINFTDAAILEEGHDVYWETYTGIGRVHKLGIEKLEENGFFDAVKNGLTLTVKIDFKIWWDGWWECPVMEIKDSETVYLDNETGVEEFVNWVLNDMY